MESFSVDQLFLTTVALIFLLTLLGAVVRRLRKDRCLGLMHDHHVTYLAEGQPALWGDLWVFSQGIEVRFDSPFVNLRNLTKTASLVYEDDFAKTLAICRTVFGLTLEELSAPEKQIARSVNPSLLRRIFRSLGNLLNMVRDAIVNTVSMFMGRLPGAGGLGAAAKSQTGQIRELSGTLLGMVANAYEPLLERLIGKPVVLEITYPEDAPAASGGVPKILGRLQRKVHRSVQSQP